MPRDAMAEWLANRKAEKTKAMATPEQGAVRQAQIKMDKIRSGVADFAANVPGLKPGKQPKAQGQEAGLMQDEGRDAMAEWLAARKESKVQKAAEMGKYAARNLGSAWPKMMNAWGDMRRENEWQGVGADAGIRRGGTSYRLTYASPESMTGRLRNAMQTEGSGAYQQRRTRMRGEKLEQEFLAGLNQNQTPEQHQTAIREELQELREMGKSGSDANAASEKWNDVANRMLYLAYTQGMGSEAYNALSGEVYDAYDAYRDAVKGRSFGEREQKWTDVLRGPVMGDENYTAAGKAQQNAMLEAAGRIPEDRNTYAYEMRYNQATTRENIQYKDVDTLLDAAGKHVDPQADVSSQSQGAATDAAIFGYLANVEMTKAQYDRYMQLLDDYAKKAPSGSRASGYTTDDVKAELEQFRAQRIQNGLRGNEQGAEDALNHYPEITAGSFVDQVAIGSERARDNLFDKYPAGLEQLLVRGGGYAGKALGSLLNGFGSFENALGNYFVEGGEKNIQYQNPDWQEAKYQEYVRGRESSDLLQNGGKFERWAAEQISGLTTAALEMAASSTIAGAATGDMAAFATEKAAASPIAASAATKAESFARMAKQGSNIVTSSFAAINAYGESESSGDEKLDRLVRFAASGLLEYGTNMLFGGNPLIDSGDTGKVTELVYRLTKNETIRKIVSSGAFDRIGEGLEEVASAIGSAALDYALTGEAELSWEELRDEFISGFALAMVLSIGPDAAEVLAKNDHEGNAKRITMFDAAAQSDRGELNLQMEKYTVEFLAGDEDLMLANGWDHLQRSEAKKNWQRAVSEYNTVYRTLVDAEAYWAKTEDGRAYQGTDAERIIADARGSIEGVDAKTFTAETLEENVRQIRQAWDNAGQHAANPALTGSMDAEIAKMARTAESYLDKAVQNGTMDAMTALNLRNELTMINEGATANLQAYLNARYGEATPRAEGQQKGAEQSVDTIRAEAEQNAAMNAAETGGTDNGRTQVFDGSSQRNAGMGTGEQTGGVEAGAAAAEGNRRNAYTGAAENGQGNGRTNLRPEDAARAERLNRYAGLQSDTSLSQLVRGGSDAVTLAVIPAEMYTDGMRAAVQEAESLGVQLRYVRGSMAMSSEEGGLRSINGVYDPESRTAVISATTLQYEPEQLAQHELYHAKVRDDPEIRQEALRKIREMYGAEAFEAVAQAYVQAYGGVYDGMDAVYEEVLADAYAGMNRFRAGATQFGEAVRGAAQQQSESAAEPGQTSQETRGSPEGGSSLAQADVKQRFSLSEPVERAGNLVAEHNLTQEKLEKTLEIGGFPSPSIAIVQAEQGHTNYGDYTVVFPASTIDPQADNRNRVYGGDAWTPTGNNARVDYEVNYDAMRAVEKRIGELSRRVLNGAFSRDGLIRSLGVGDVTSYTAEEIARRLSDYDEVRAAYLADRGETLEPAYKTKVYNRYGNAALQTYIDSMTPAELADIIMQMETGNSKVVHSQEEAVRKIIRDTYEKEHESFLNRKPEQKQARLDRYMENNVTIFTVERFLRDAWRYYVEGGSVTDEIDRIATSDKLREVVSADDVAAWLLPQLDGMLGKPGIYNGKELYDALGNRKSFKATHYPYTAENIVRAMNDASERGEGMWGPGASGLIATATPEYGSMEEIHADEGRLRTVAKETYDTMLAELDDRMERIVRDIMRTTKHHTSNQFDEEQIVGSIIIGAATKGKTASSVQKAFAKEDYAITKVQAQRIVDLFKEAAIVPTGYFEAKPRRVVEFDEAVALLAPENAPRELLDRVRDAGLRVIQYEDNADRLKKVNELPGVRFSVADEIADIRENGIKGREIIPEQEDTDPGNVLRSEPVTPPKSYFRDWVVRPKQETVKWGKDVPLYSDETNLSPRKAVELLEAATGKRWSVQPRKSGGWRAVETKIAARQSAIAPDTAAAQLYAAAEAQKAANKEAYQQGENPKPARSVYAEGVPKADFRATPALEKIGVKIDMGVTDYRTTKQMRERAEAEYQTNRLIQKAEKRWGATALEKNFARDIAAGRYSYFDIPDTARWDAVTDLANLYIDKRMLGEDLRLQRKAAIRDNLLYKAMELLPDELELMQDPNAFHKEALLIMNYRTPQRSMLKMFGDKRGEEINRYYFDPVTRNEAERLRWMNRQFDSVREFEGADGKTKELSRAESAYVHMLLDIESTQQRINSSEKKSAILKAAEELQKMEAEQKTTRDAEAREAAIQRAAADYDLNAVESRWAQQYASFLAAQKGFRSAGEIDEKKTAAAAEVYRKLFDDYYDAIADFMVSHGDEPIGKVDFYAPHMTTADKVNLLNQAFEALGFNASATRLPAEIAGRTEDFRPNKRWTPFFQSRTGSKTDYDIVEGFESYVTYVSDVLFHTDDIMKIRQLENYARLGGRSNETNALADAIELSRSGKRDEKLDFLREMKIFDDFSEPTDAQIREGLDAYIRELILSEKNSTRYSDLAVWLKNYGDVLAGKQFGGDRGAEHRGGRGILRMGTKLAQSFAKANVAGNVSSAANQIAQLPTILAERSKRSVAQATAEFTAGKLKAFAEESDFITGKKGADYISSSVTDKLMTGLFKPAEFVDGMMSTIATRAAYLDAIRDGKTHEEAMRAADQYGRSIMGDRTKGAKPLMFQSKTPVMQMINMFQIEALNSWEHISQDLPREFRQIERESGKAKAARHLAAVALKTVLAAFVVNRITEELYGGTPAPFDVIGMSANFVASGEGLTTNDWIRSLLNKASSAMFGAELFDDVPEAQESFDVGSAVEDTVWNISNEVPFLSNVSGLMGLGDRTMPMPDLYGAASDIWNAASKNGVISPETGEAMLGLLTQVIPGGRQIKKTYSGAKTLIEGGKTTGFGERKRLQYPVDRDVGTILQNLLFGPNATQDASAYWASGQGSLSPHDTQTWQTLAGDGADSIEVYNLLHKAIKINADDTLTTAEAQRDIRDAIGESSLTDEQKAYLFRQEFGKRNAETGEYEHATDAMFEALMSAGVSWGGVMDFYNTLQSADADEETTTNEKNRTKRNAIRQLDVEDGTKAYTYAEVFGTRDAETGQKTTSKDELFAELMDAGMSWDDIMEVYEEYRALYEDETLSTSQQATEFAYWLDGQGLTKQQRQIVNDGLKYYQMFAQQADRYRGLTEAGLSSSDAKRVSDSMAKAEGTGKDGQLTTGDKVEVLLKQKLSDASLYKALGTILAEDAFDKLTEAKNAGISAKAWIGYWQEKAGISADKDASGKTISGSKKAKIMALINSLQITAAQKDMLYRAEGYAERDINKAPWH